MTRLARLLALPLAATLALGVSACGSSSDSTSPSASSGEAAYAGGGKAVPLDQADLDQARTPVDLPAPAAGQPVAEPAVAIQQRAVIETGAVSLTSPDVAKARFELQKVVDDLRGQIDDENTVTGKQGEIRMTRLVVRVPVTRFDEAMTRFAKVGTLVEQSRKAQDVTTEVIDTAARMRAQQASVDRVQALLARASTISEIVDIETQLTRRQADLDSLRQQAAYLKDQTELSTINVYVEKARGPVAHQPSEHHNAFVAGLIKGWDAFSDLGAGVAKAAGASLPFLGLLALLAFPAWLLVRRFVAWSRRTSGVAPAEG